MTFKRIALLVATAVLAPGATAAGQNATDSSAARARRARHVAVEHLLRLRSELQLSEEQVGRLEALRREQVEARAARIQEMLELTSQVRAGDLTREDLRSRMAARRDAVRAAEGRGEGVERILTDEQRQRAAGLRRQAVRRHFRQDMRRHRMFDRRDVRRHRTFDRGRRGARPRPMRERRGDPSLFPAEDRRLGRGW